MGKGNSRLELVLVEMVWVVLEVGLVVAGEEVELGVPPRM
jgi:hypothetical protein